jgi:hypothetical protein
MVSAAHLCIGTVRVTLTLWSGPRLGYYGAPGSRVSPSELEELTLQPAERTPTAPHFNGRSNVMMPIEEAIVGKLRSGPCCLDEVVTGLPDFSWGEIFVAVDGMSRDGRLFLCKLGFSSYQISLGS